MNNIYLYIRNIMYGPYSYDQLKWMIENNRVEAETLCWQEGFENWETAAKAFPQLFSTQSTSTHFTGSTKPTIQKKKETSNLGVKIILFSFATIVSIAIALVLIWIFASHGRNSLPELKKQGATLITDSMTSSECKSKKLVTNSYKEEKIRLNGITVTLPPGFVKNNDEKISVSYINGLSAPWGRFEARPIDISIGNHHKLENPIEIEMTAYGIGNRIRNGARLVCYMIPGKGQLPVAVPSFISADGNSVKILTDHLSTYFPMTYIPKHRIKYSPVMKLSEDDIPYYIHLRRSTANKLCYGYRQNLKQMGGLSKKYYWSLFNEVFAVETNFTAIMENAMYVDSLEPLNRYIPEIGLGLSVLQFSIDMYNGKKSEGVLNFTKSSFLYKISKSFPTRAMNIAMVGVFVIDYSLNKFGSSAWAGRKELYTKIGEKWLQKHQNNGQNIKWWRKRLWGVIHKNEKTPWKISSSIEKSFDDYIGTLWNTPSELALAQIDLKKKMKSSWGFSGGLERLEKGLKTSMKSHLKQYCSSLLTDITRKVMLNQQRAIRSRLIETARFLNIEHEIRFVLEPGKGESINDYDGTVVGLVVKDMRKARYWKKILSKHGEISIHCTNLGYIGVGAPRKVYMIYPAKNGEKGSKVVVNFKLKNGPNTVVKIPFHIKTNLAGKWRGTWQFTNAHKLAQTIRKYLAKILVMVRAVKSYREAMKIACDIVEVDKDASKKHKMIAVFHPSSDGIVYSISTKLFGTKNASNSFRTNAKADENSVSFSLRTKDGYLLRFKGKMVTPNKIDGSFDVKHMQLNGHWVLNKISK